MHLKTTYLSFICALCTTLFVQAQQADVTVDQDKDIDKLLEYKKDVATVKMYKIQIYQSVDPDLAKEAEQDFKLKYNNWPSSIQWQTPNYKIWVGNFSTRLAADRALLVLKKDYPDAIIFQPKK